MTDRIYVASRASLPARSRMWREYRAAGADIVSSWIYRAGEGETADMSELWTRIQDEIRSCDRLVLYVEPSDFPMKVAFVEVWMALAFGKPVFVVAPGVDFGKYGYRSIGSWMSRPLVSTADDAQTASAVTPWRNDG